MADKKLLATTRSLDNQGREISTKMMEFLDSVKSQPLGFRDLGIDFLAICKIVSALKISLEEHFQTQQSFPERAVPELTSILSKTAEDFKQLHVLLQKFMDFEKGGARARFQKSWRMVFADKDIAKTRNSLKENRGALNMTLLLTNMLVNI